MGPSEFSFPNLSSRFVLFFELRDLSQESKTPGTCFMTQIRSKRGILTPNSFRTSSKKTASRSKKSSLPGVVHSKCSSASQSCSAYLSCPVSQTPSSLHSSNLSSRSTNNGTLGLRPKGSPSYPFSSVTSSPGCHSFLSSPGTTRFVPETPTPSSPKPACTGFYTLPLSKRLDSSASPGLAWDRHTTSTGSHP